jgi:nucleoside-diphosphate-sugar epimerase
MILLTGATGYIASHIWPALRAACATRDLDAARGR